LSHTTIRRMWAAFGLLVGVIRYPIERSHFCTSVISPISNV
jgi:hypothetical protein